MSLYHRIVYITDGDKAKKRERVETGGIDRSVGARKGRKGIGRFDGISRTEGC